MKLKHIITLHIAIIAGLMAILLSGCAMTEAQKEAGDLYFRQHSGFPIATSWGETLRRPPSRLLCRHRVAIVGRGMVERGDTFDIVYGENRRGDKHVWIVQYHEGRELLIEPTIMDGQVAYFRYNQLRSRYRPGENDEAIEVINIWLREIGAKALEPVKE